MGGDCEQRVRGLLQAWSPQAVSRGTNTRLPGLPSQPETQQGPTERPAAFVCVFGGEGEGTRGRITDSRDANRHLHTYVHSSNTHNSHRWEAPQRSTEGRGDTRHVTTHGVFLGPRRKEALQHATAGGRRGDPVLRHRVTPPAGGTGGHSQRRAGDEGGGGTG